MTLDVRQTFQTDDGALIQVFETGRTQPGAGPGGNITTAYVQLAFETGADAYAWINQAVAVGVLHRLDPGSISIDVWVVCLVVIHFFFCALLHFSPISLF